MGEHIDPVFAVVTSALLWTFYGLQLWRARRKRGGAV